MEQTTNKLSIKEWSEQDRPREKLVKNGISSLSNAELIAILIGSGNTDESAVEVAKRILQHADNNLNELADFSLKKLQSFKGIGEAKAINILSAIELGKRRQEETIRIKKKISSSEDAYLFMNAVLENCRYESFWVLLLNRANRIIEKIRISEGGVAGTVADPKKIFKIALDHQASSIILCHNHPSGNTSPSRSDIDLTSKIKEAGALLDISILDHLIIGQGAYYSFADEGMM